MHLMEGNTKKKMQEAEDSLIRSVMEGKQAYDGRLKKVRKP